MRSDARNQSTQIQPAAPASRRRAVTFLVLLTITALAVIIGFEQWLAVIRDEAARNQQQASDQIAYVIGILAAIVSLSVLGLALVLARVSWRTYAARRFPPPGMTLVFAVHVKEGLTAVWRALAGFAFATILGATAVAMPYVLWRMMSMVVLPHSG